MFKQVPGSVFADPRRVTSLYLLSLGLLSFMFLGGSWVLALRLIGGSVLALQKKASKVGDLE